MKLKVLILSLFLFISSFGAFGANSINALGFTKISVPPGFSFIANQYSNSSDAVKDILTNIPAGTVLYTWDNGFVANVFNLYEDDKWDSPDTKLSPGSGAIIYNPTDAPFLVVFAGGIKQGEISTPVKFGFQVISSQIPQAGSISSLGYVAKDGDVIYKWDNGFSVYVYNLYEDHTWDPSEPTLGYGDSAILYSTSDSNWVRNFTL